MFLHRRICPTRSLLYNRSLLPVRVTAPPCRPVAMYFSTKTTAGKAASSSTLRPHIRRDLMREEKLKHLIRKVTKKQQKDKAVHVPKQAKTTGSTTVESQTQTVRKQSVHIMLVRLHYLESLFYRLLERERHKLRNQLRRQHKIQKRKYHLMRS